MYHESQLFGFNWEQIERVCKIFNKEMTQELFLDLRLIISQITEVFNNNNK